MRRWSIAVAIALAIAVVLIVTRCGSTPDDPRRAAAPASPHPRARAGSAAGPEAPAQVDDAVPLTGTVRDAITKAPIAGARVCTDDRCATTDEAGAFVLDATPGTIAASAPRYIPARAEADAQVPVDIALYPGGAEITGVVVDGDDHPIAGAHVGLETAREVDTDASGTFHLWSRPGMVGVFAAADGFVPNSASGVAPGAFTIRLEPEAFIDGLVVDDAGTPVAGADIEARGDYFRRATSDARGRFHLPGLLGGHYLLVGSADHGAGYSDASIELDPGQHLTGIVVRLHHAARLDADVFLGDAPCANPVVHSTERSSRILNMVAIRTPGHVVFPAVPPGGYSFTVSCDGVELAPQPMIEVGERDVSLTWRIAPKPSATISGHVTNGRGSDIEGAEVILDRHHSARTGHDGGYRFDHIPFGEYRVLVHASGMAQQHAEHLAVTEAATRLDVELVAAAALAVTVVDENGRPYPDVEVRAGCLDGEEVLSNTDPRGVAQFVDLMPCRTFVQGGGNHADADLHPGDRAEVRIVDPRVDFSNVPTNTATLAGTVVSATGAPVDALVQVTCSPHGYDYFGRFEPARDGSFSVVVLAGPCTLVAARGTLTTAPVAVTVERGGIVDNIVLTFREGRVAGRTVPGARVQLTEVTPPGRAVVAGADGRFAFEHVSPGDVQLTVTPPDGSTAIIRNGTVAANSTFDAGDVQPSP